MILKNIRYLVTQNPNRQILRNVDVKIIRDEIVGISKEMDTRGHDVLNCSNKIVMPGLVNAHTHVSMTLLRGISDNKNLEDWLNQDIFPAEDKLNREDIFYGAALGMIEMLKTGTTTLNDMYDEMDMVAEAVNATGIRAVLSKGLIDIEGGKKEKLEQAKNFTEKYNSEKRITPGIAPHAVYTVSPELLKESKQLAEQHNTLYHIHVSETMKENQECKEETGLTPLAYLDSLDLVDNNLIAAHGVWLTEEDLNIIQRKNASVIHNPAANLKLGSGIAEVPLMLEKNINVALGTDGPASNNNLNLFEEGKLASLLHKRAEPSRINEQQILDMLTINGAKALNMENKIGSIEIGKKADLITIDLDQPCMKPVKDSKTVVSHLIYSFNGGVCDVVVDGAIVLRNGEFVTVDEDSIYDEVDKRVERLY